MTLSRKKANSLSRSAPKRKEHPENRGSTMPPRTKRINRVSKSKRKEKADTDHLRRLVRTDPVTGDPVACCICGENEADQTHEITRGTAARSLAVYRPRLQLPVCGECNCERLTNYDEWPIERQLAVSIRLTLQEANQVRGRSPLAITLEDLEPWL